MGTWRKRSLGGLLLVGIAAVGMSACADNESSIFIRQVLAPEESCDVTADPASPALGAGFMDLAFRTEYSAWLLVGNQLVERGAAEMVRTETSRFEVTGAEVRIETTDGRVLGPASEYTIPVSGFADPTGGTDPGYGAVSVVMINDETGRLLASSFPANERSSAVGRVVSVVKVFGQTLGGQELESGEFRFPINVCYGCLVTVPSDGSPCQPDEDAGEIPMPCVMGQDEPIDCRLCYSAGNICDI